MNDKKIKKKVLKAKAITPFDEENVENLNTMDFKFDDKRKIDIVSNEVGKRRFLK